MAGPSPKVLILEDDESQASLVEAFLARHGISCKVVGTLGASIPILMQESLDFLVMDLRLPDGSALDLLPLLDASPNATAKVVISSGLPASEVALHERIDRVFEKPYSVRALVAYLQASEA